MATIVLATALLRIPSSAASVPERPFVSFDHIPAPDALDDGVISAFAQDPDGRILIGSSSGLHQYDGVQVAKFSGLALADRASGGRVLRILYDQAGRLWVVTSEDIYVRRRPDSAFVRLYVASSCDLRSSRNFAPAADGIVFIAGGALHHLTITADDTFHIGPIATSAADLSEMSPSPAGFVLAGNDGSLLYGCRDGVCEVGNGKAERVGAASGLPPDRWLTGVEGGDGTLWLRSATRIAWRRAHASRFETASLPARPRTAMSGAPEEEALAADAHGSVVTQGPELGGLLRWDGARWWSYARHEGGLPPSPVDALFFDRNGTFWVGTESYGLYRGVGFGAWDQVTIDSDHDQAVPIPPPNWGWSRQGSQWAPGPDGGIWSITPGGRVLRQDRLGQDSRLLPLPAAITSILADRTGLLWIGTQNGLYRMPNTADQSVSPQLILQQPVMQIELDSQDLLWVMDPAGLYQVNSFGSMVMVLPEPVDQEDGGGFTIGQDGSIWTFSHESGLAHLRMTEHGPTRLATYWFPDISSNTIRSLLCDSTGRIWVGTDRGIDGFDGTAWHHLRQDDGLLSNEILPNAFLEMPDGTFWFGTRHGVSHLLDAADALGGTDLHPRIIAIRYGARRVSPSSRIVLDADGSPLTVQLLDPDYGARHVTFRYRMAGLDADWADVAGNEIDYPRMPPGRYRFEVEAIDAGHGAASRPVGIDIELVSPWWRRPWFEGLAAGVVCLALWLLWRLRILFLLRGQRRLETMIQQRTMEIEQARRELERLALVDSLTGLANRRALMERLNRSIVDAVPLGVLLCDIDHFKRINDENGHLAGDDVLARLGACLCAAVAADGFAARYGGEEFVVVLPGDRRCIEDSLGAIRQAMVGLNTPGARGARPVTISIGVAQFSPGDTAERLIARADAALYRAKRLGRDRVEWEQDRDGRSGEESNRPRRVGDLLSIVTAQHRAPQLPSL